MVTHVALVCLPPAAKKKNAGAVANPKKLAKLEAAQTLALALRLRDGEEFDPLIVCARGSLLDAAARELELESIALSGSVNPFKYWRLWKWQRKRASVLTFTIGESALKLGAWLSKKRRSPLWTSFFFNAPACAGRQKKILLKAERYLCGSEEIATRLAWNLAPGIDLPIVVTPPGVDLKAYRRSTPWPGGKKRFVFGMGASLSKNSGAILVIRAMAAIWQQADLPPWETRMFGGGPRFREILDEAEALGVESRLSILADQPLSSVAGECDAWLAPGGSPDELPEVLWAGFAAGLPVICSASSLHEERLSEFPGAAIRVAENNPQELAGAMLKVIRDAETRSLLREASDKLRPAIGLNAMASRAREEMLKWRANAISGSGVKSDAQNESP